MKIVLLACLLAALAMLLSRLQRRMIYFPRPYPATLVVPPGVETLAYRTGQGRQVAFYLPPSQPPPGGGSPSLWLVCGGNAALALDWLELLDNFPDPAAAFLLLDYPGYGHCQGRPSPAAIGASLDQALSALATRLTLPVAEVRDNLQALGHSLGAAVVLLAAVRWPMRRLVLISPFTSLKAMGALLVGRWLSHTLLHDYDNRARLREVLAQAPPVPITILHGSHDRIVPVAMGRELATLSPRIDYREIERGDHNYLLLTHAAEIRRAMLDQARP